MIIYAILFDKKNTKSIRESVSHELIIFLSLFNVRFSAQKLPALCVLKRKISGICFDYTYRIL